MTTCVAKPGTLCDDLVLFSSLIFIGVHRPDSKVSWLGARCLSVCICTSSHHLESYSVNHSTGLLSDDDNKTIPMVTIGYQT